MEQKIYARSVTKTGVSHRVIDGKSLNRCFSAKELEDMQELITWVQCEKCEKWRVLLQPTEDELPEKWYCEMNDDVDNNSCDHPERDQKWYEDKMQRDIVGNALVDSDVQSEVASNSGDGDAMSEADKQALVQRDEVLQHILGIQQSTKQTAIVSRYEFHEALLEADDKVRGPSKSKQSQGSPTAAATKLSQATSSPSISTLKDPPNSHSKTC